jgi:hypothetical protein
MEMTSAGTLIVAAVAAVALSSPLGAASLAKTLCQEPTLGSDAAPMFSPPLANVVIGEGRLQFYSAPDIHCRVDGVFVMPRDQLIAYGQTNDGWSSVVYLKGGATGWVRSSRLKVTGEVGPHQ